MPAFGRVVEIIPLIWIDGRVALLLRSGRRFLLLTAKP